MGMMNLKNLAKKYNSNKVSQKLPFLLPSYDFYFQNMRKNVRSIFEIGILEGNSLRIWEEYFPNSKLYGLDIQKKNIDNLSNRCKIFIGNQNNINTLRTITKEIGLIDIIIDDGSHNPTDQIISFDFLFENMLKPGGVYVIEDTHTSYYKKRPGSLIPRIIDLVNSMHFYRRNFNKPNHNATIFDRWVASVHIHPSIIFIFKHYEDSKKYWKNIYEKLP